MSEHHAYDDKELLRRIAAGDEGAFTILFDRYRAKIYTVGLKLTRSEHHAEELVQEIFLKIWMKREALPMIDSFDNYLFTMTRNAAMLALRQTLRRNEVDITATDNFVSLDTGLEHLLEVKEYQQLLKKAVDRLPTQQGKVYQLMKEQGYKREEVADMLGISPLSVKKNLQVAMRSVRAHMLANMDLHAIMLAAWGVADLVAV